MDIGGERGSLPGVEGDSDLSRQVEGGTANGSRFGGTLILFNPLPDGGPALFGCRHRSRETGLRDPHR
jgi:hypothetical protein